MGQPAQTKFIWLASFSAMWSDGHLSDSQQKMARNQANYHYHYLVRGEMDPHKNPIIIISYENLITMNH
jgi:hypothetical protein